MQAQAAYAGMGNAGRQDMCGKQPQAQRGRMLPCLMPLLEAAGGTTRTQPHACGTFTMLVGQVGGGSVVVGVVVVVYSGVFVVAGGRWWW